MFHLHHFRTIQVDEDGFSQHTTHHTYLLQACPCGKTRVITLPGHWKDYFKETL